MSGILVERSASVAPPEVGETIAFPEGATPTPSRPPWLALAMGIVVLLGVGGLLLVGGGVYLWLQSAEAPEATIAAVPVPAPEPAPVMVTAPAPEPPPAATPVPAPMPVPATKPAPARPAPSGPRVDKALVVLKNAQSLTVTCGDVRAPGSSSARITSFPAGECTVKAVYDDETYETRVTITRSTTVDCTVDGSLKCSMR
jgi:hypothetical protein